MTDYDATAHITEEMDEPEKKAPWAIFSAMALTYVMGWIFTIVLVFTMGDPLVLLDNELEQPVIQLFYNNLGRAGAITFAACAFVILNSCAIAAIQSLARTVFAFSRDRLIPGSRYLKIVDKRTDTPIIAVWWSVFWCAAINLIALGSYEAISAIFNVCAIAMDWSYCIPILCKLIYGKFEPGPWYMGKASFFVNAYACLWTAFVSIIFLFPTYYPVTVVNMVSPPILSLSQVIYADFFFRTGQSWSLLEFSSVLVSTGSSVVVSSTLDLSPRPTSPRASGPERKTRLLWTKRKYVQLKRTERDMTSIGIMSFPQRDDVKTGDSVHMLSSLARAGSMTYRRFFL